MEDYNRRAEAIAPDTGVSPMGYWFALALFILGNVFGIQGGYEAYKEISSRSENRFLAPGSIEISVTSNELSYTVWNEVETIFEGTAYSSSETPPNTLQISVFQMGTQKKIPIESSGGARISSGSAYTRISMGSIEFPEPGSYQVVAEGMLAPRVLSVRPALWPVLFSASTHVAGWMAAAWLFAPLIAIISFVRRTRSKETADSRFSSESDSSAPRGENEKERSLALLMHVSAAIGLIIPFGSILGPLICWAMYRDHSEFVALNGRESLNFQLTMLLYGFACILLLFVFIGFLLLPLVGVFWIVMIIRASIAAQKGELFHYPLTIRFL